MAEMETSFFYHFTFYFTLAGKTYCGGGGAAGLMWLNFPLKIIGGKGGKGGMRKKGGGGAFVSSNHDGITKTMVGIQFHSIQINFTNVKCGRIKGEREKKKRSPGGVVHSR